MASKFPKWLVVIFIIINTAICPQIYAQAKPSINKDILQAFKNCDEAQIAEQLQNMI